MKRFIFLLSITLAAANIEYYTTADDYLDVDKLVADVPRLQSFVKCFLDKGPCTELTQSYKVVIPDAIKTYCRRCNVAQKRLGRGFLAGLKVVLPHEYKNFRRHYDHENKYFDKFERSLLN